MAVDAFHSWKSERIVRSTAEEPDDCERASHHNPLSPDGGSTLVWRTLPHVNSGQDGRGNAREREHERVRVSVLFGP